MAAIITENHRKNLAALLKTDAQSSSSYYIGIGKSDAWYDELTPPNESPFPVGTHEATLAAKYAITDLLKVNTSDFAEVIPLHTLTNGHKYKQYNPYDSATLYPSSTHNPSYFVDLVGGNVYVFVYSPDVNLVVTSNDLINITSPEANIFRIGEATTKHVIARVGKIKQYSKFNNEQFVEIDTALNTSADYLGNAYGLHIVNGGDLNGASTSVSGISIMLDGVNASGTNVSYTITNVTASVDVNGKITALALPTSFYTDLINKTSLVTFKAATARISSVPDGITINELPVIVPLLSNVNGFSYDVRRYTPAWYVCFLANSRSAVSPVYGSYSQISLLKNPKNTSGTVLTTAAVSTLNSFVLTGYTGSINVGDGIVQIQSSVTKYIGVVHSYNSATKTVYYTKGYHDGVNAIDGAKNISIVNRDTQVVTDTGKTPSSITSSTYDPHTGDVVFLENRAQIIRSADQNEELKIIIQL